jgi:protease IV
MSNSSGLRSLRYLFPRTRERVRRNRVAIIRLYGPITGGERSADWIELVRRTRESRRIPAVVLDVDSPGGAASASDNMYAALARLAEKKPLVAAIRGTGASGSYLAAIAAKRIVATPTSVIGSIGVITAAPRLPRLLEKIGVSVSEHTAGRLKGMGAPWRDESEPEAAKEQQLVDEIYDVFVDRVATARKMDANRVRELATGEVWLGAKALELGLVDEIGDLERAIEIAAEMAGVPAKAASVSLPRPILARLTDRFATGIADSVVRELEYRLSDRIRL